MSIFGNLITVPLSANLSEIIQMDLCHFPRPWSQRDWEVLTDDHHLLYAWQETAVSGFALFGRVADDETVHLLKICILPAFRGKGLAGTFWSGIQEDLKSRGVQSVYLEVEKTNLPGVKFYFKQGFQTLREIKDFYSDGTTALTMNLML